MNQSLRFDKKDRDLLVKINEVIDSGNVSSAEQETFRTSLHPHGIQNMVSTHEERMAMAEVNLLQRLNDGTASRRGFLLLKRFMKKCCTAPKLHFVLILHEC